MRLLAGLCFKNVKGRESQMTEKNNELLFRRAVPPEKSALQKLQIDVFSGEQGIPPEEVPVLPSLAPQYWCAVKDSVPIGAVAAWREEGKVHWGRFAVKKEYRGQHIGQELALYSLRDLFSQQVDTIYLGARDATVKLMEKWGGKAIGASSFFHGSAITPVILQRDDFWRAQEQGEIRRG